MLRACEKRPVSYQQLDEAVSRIEQQLLNSYDREVTSIHIGDLAMQELKKMDDVAYVRFASVYRQFSDVNTFMGRTQGYAGYPLKVGRKMITASAGPVRGPAQFPLPDRSGFPPWHSGAVWPASD